MFPPYTVLNQHIDYKYVAERDIEVPVPGRRRAVVDADAASALIAHLHILDFEARFNRLPRLQSEIDDLDLARTTRPGRFLGRFRRSSRRTHRLRVRRRL